MIVSEIPNGPIFAAISRRFQIARVNYRRKNRQYKRASFTPARAIDSALVYNNV